MPATNAAYIKGRMNSQNYRLQVWYSGRVQGVGFRWKAAETAKGYDVCGYVENLDDGRVHLCAKGEKSEVRAFAAKMERTFALPVAFWDERLSSSAMESFLIKEVDLSRAKRKKVLDASAAAYILQGFLDALKRV